MRAELLQAVSAAEVIILPGVLEFMFGRRGIHRHATNRVYYCGLPVLDGLKRHSALPN
jgi:hypothetical protein